MMAAETYDKFVCFCKQAPGKTPPPPPVWQEPNGGAEGENNGIQVTLEMIADDIDKDIREATAVEETSQKEFDEFTKDSEETVAELEEQISRVPRMSSGEQSATEAEKPVEEPPWEKSATEAEKSAEEPSGERSATEAEKSAEKMSEEKPAAVAGKPAEKPSGEKPVSEVKKAAETLSGELGPTSPASSPRRSPQSRRSTSTASTSSLARSWKEEYDQFMAGSAVDKAADSSDIDHKTSKKQNQAQKDVEASREDSQREFDKLEEYQSRE